MNLEVSDIKNAVKAMRADPRCNGWVAVVGGSAGGTHAITVALIRTRHPETFGRTGFKAATTIALIAR
jgi:homoserine acetyltransferase